MKIITNKKYNELTSEAGFLGSVVNNLENDIKNIEDIVNGKMTMKNKLEEIKGMIKTIKKLEGIK